MTGSQGKQRGSDPQDAVHAARIRRRWLVALLGTTLVAGAVAIALAVRQESCADIGPTLNPQDAAIICALRNQETPRCPPEELTPEECAEIIDEFNHPPG